MRVRYNSVFPALNFGVFVASQDLKCLLQELFGRVRIRLALNILL